MTVPSDATHDTSALIDLRPVIMLFVCFRGGVKRLPDEHAGGQGLNVAAQELERAKILLTNPALTLVDHPVQSFRR